MGSKRLIAALAASAGLLWASAQAADEPPVQAAPELPSGVIIFELQPAEPGVLPEGQAPQAADPAAQAQEQAMLSMLLLQLLSGMEAPSSGGEPVETQPLPPNAQRI